MTCVFSSFSFLVTALVSDYFEGVFEVDMVDSGTAVGSDTEEDSGTVADSGTAEGSGTVVDFGIVTDSGTEEDSGTVVDFGTVESSGTV